MVVEIRILDCLDGKYIVPYNVVVLCLCFVW